MKLIAILFSFLVLSPSANAVFSINTQTFNPSTSRTFVLLEDAYRSEWPKEAKLHFGANYNYASEPLIALASNATGAGAGRAFSIIDAIQTLDLMIGFKASARFGIFFGLPIHFVKFPDNQFLGIRNHTSSVLGDMKILGKVRFTDDDSSLHVALIPEIHLPTGSTADFVSDASTYIGVRMALERQFNKFTLNGNIGYAAASNAKYESPLFASIIDYRQRFNFGIGGYVPFNPLWGMSLEFNSIHMVPFDKNVNPNELYAGLRHAFEDNASFTAGISLGKIGGDSGMNYRMIAGIRFNTYEGESKPVPPTRTRAPVYQAPVAPIAPLQSRPVQRVVMKQTRIELSEPVNFEEDSSLLTQEGKALLDEVAEVMKKHQGAYSKILIDGHTNNNGGEKHNLWLSLERSKAVKHYLIGKGIPKTSLEARGFGQIKPRVKYDHPRAEELNRRVEFNVVQ